MLLDNRGELRDDFYDAAVKEYFKEWEGCDFQIGEQSITVGIEPTYQFDELKIFSICLDIGESSYITGKSWGPYGSGIAKRVRYYRDYKSNCKFTRFVNTWHPILFPKTVP